uniref:Uncharacterized protein n=1 Tax=viral metagenome TaxID=1070528 RepID=A0A6C0LMP0_9ZZZZ
MKIYVDHLSMSNLKLNKLDTYLISKNKKLELFSTEGLFVITDRNMFKVTILEENKTSYINHYIGHLNIIVDHSRIELKKIVTVPNEHLIVQNIEYTYKLSKNDDTTLVIHFTPKKTVFNVKGATYTKGATHTKGDTHTKGATATKDDLEVIDFYFETQEQNVNEDGFKNKIIKFLSLLSYI